MSDDRNKPGAMPDGSPGHTKRAWLGYAVVATADKLVIRPPIASVGVVVLFLLLSVLLPWSMVAIGLLDRGFLTPFSLMLVGGITFFMILLCRWRTLGGSH